MLLPYYNYDEDCDMYDITPVIYWKYRATGTYTKYSTQSNNKYYLRNRLSSTCREYIDVCSFLFFTLLWLYTLIFNDRLVNQ